MTTHPRRSRPLSRSDTRRPEKGPRHMPKRITKRTLTTAGEAAGVLAEQGKTEMADAVSDVVAYAQGILDSGAQKTAGASSVNLAISVNVDFHAHTQAAAKARGVWVTDLVIEGLEKFLSGEWSPAQPGPEMTGPKRNINARVPKKLAQQVAAQAKALAKSKGWARMATTHRIALTYLVEECGLPDSLAEWEPSTPLQIGMDDRRWQHIKAGMDAEGALPPSLVREALERLADGAWEPARELPNAPAGGTHQKRVKAWVPDRVLNRALARAEELSRARGWAVMSAPQRIVTAYLVERYGLPASETNASESG